MSRKAERFTALIRFSLEDPDAMRPLRALGDDSIGLSLESARSVVGDGSAGQRLATATDAPDATIRDIRTAVLSLPDGWPSQAPRR